MSSLWGDDPREPESELDRTLGLFARVVGFFVRPKPTPSTEPEPDHDIESEALDRKVLHVLQARLRHLGALDIWMSHNYDQNYWVPILDAEQTKIDSIRAWARNQSDRAIRHSYLQWLDYYFEIALRDARKELETQTILRNHRVYDKKQNRIHVAALEKIVPEPPR